jgi:hypothetical protein
MTNEILVSVNNRDIYFRTDGAINGDVVTVASMIVWSDDKTPIEDLTISDQFISGNYLPVGDLRATNRFYDLQTGIYWFDVKLKDIIGEAHVILQTTGTANGSAIPVRFEFNLVGPSPLVVSPVSFNGNKMEFDVSAKQGKLLRYPLALLASREIDGNADAPASKEKKIPYSFYVPISNNDQNTYAVMGQAEVDGLKYNFVARASIKTNDGTVTVEQIGENLLAVDVKLSNVSTHIGIGLPLKFQFSNGTYGIVNQVQNFSAQGDTVHFEFLVNDIKDQEQVTVAFHLTEGDNQDAPIFFKSSTPVKRWNNGQTKINVVVDSHTFKRTLQSLYMSVFWEDGTPVTGFKVKNVKPDAEVGGRGNRIIIARSVSLNIHQRNTLTLTGDIDLSPFGIEEVVPFSESITVGSDVLPARMFSGHGLVIGDKVFIQLAPRQNNGNIFKDVKIKSVNKITSVPDLQYDTEQGIVGFTIPNTAIKVVDDRADMVIEFLFTGEKDYSFSYKGSIKVDVPYSITVDKPVWGYRRDSLTDQVYIDATWVLRGNDGHYPNIANMTQFRVNGMDSVYTQKYNSGYGALVVSFPVDLKSGNSLYVDAVASASGLGTFLHLPAIDARYREPGTAVYVDHEFIGDKQVKVFFDIQGWGSEPPFEVQLDDQSWNRQQGVKLGKARSEYDNKKGRLTVVFDIYDINASVFSASTEMKFDFADTTVYPISFSFTK